MKIALYLVEKMQEFHIISDNKDVYIYGLKNGFLVSVNFATALFISVILNKADIFVVFMLTFIPLRSYSGGFHFNSKVNCYIFSNIIIILILEIVPFLADHILFMLGGVIISSFYILTQSNTSSKSRPLEQKEIIYFNKRKAIIAMRDLFVILLLLCVRQIEYATTAMCSIILVATLIFLNEKNNFLAA